MGLDRRSLAEEILRFDAHTRQQLALLAARLAPYRDRLGLAWNEACRESASATCLPPDDRVKLAATDLLDLFFKHVAHGDFEGYYQAVAAKGKEYEAAGLNYGHVMLVVHHFEQVTLPFLYEAFPRQEEFQDVLLALDRLADNVVVLIASSYFDTTLTELRSLQQVTDSALSSLDLDRLMQSLLRHLVEAVCGDAGAILLRDELAGNLLPRSYFGLSAPQQVVVQAVKAGEGLAGRVAADGKVVQVADAQTDPLVTDDNMKHAGVRAMVCLPLKIGPRIIGVVYLGRRNPYPYTPREIRLLELLTERAAAAIEHAQLFQRTANLLRQTAALQRVTTSITAKMALPQVLEVVIDGVVEVFGTNRVAICLHDEQTGELSCPASRALSNEFIDVVKAYYREAENGQALVTTAHLYTPDVQIDPLLDPLRPDLEREAIRTVLILPFAHGSEVAGALCLCHDDTRQYGEEERGLAQTFADQTAIAIANAKLYRDIREHAAELDRMNSELQILDRMKADFLAMISHELRTPLTAIIGYTDLLLRGARGPLNERPLADLKTIRANGQRLLTLINDLIDFSSIEAGRASIVTSSLQLGQLLPHVMRSFSSLAASRSITLDTQLPADLPPVLGDAAAVEKILGQLLSNAIKFTPPGGTVSVSASETTERRPLPSQTIAAPLRRSAAPEGGIRRVVIVVSDDGIGIPREQLSRVWDHFYQVDSSSARRFGGTGLGLAIVKRLVEMQGGYIWAESEGVPGKGAKFSFSLLVAADAGDPAAMP